MYRPRSSSEIVINFIAQGLSSPPLDTPKPNILNDIMTYTIKYLSLSFNSSLERLFKAVPHNNKP